MLTSDEFSSLEHSVDVLKHDLLYSLQLITQSSQLRGAPRLRLQIVFLDSVYLSPYVCVHGEEGKRRGEKGMGSRGGDQECLKLDVPTNRNTTMLSLSIYQTTLPTHKPKHILREQKNPQQPQTGPF